MAKNQRQIDLDDYRSVEARARREFEREMKEKEWLSRVHEPMVSKKYPFKMRWLVENFLPSGSLALLAGPAKEGKTCFATAIALAVATGKTFLGNNAQLGAVLWAAQEESIPEREAVLTLSPDYHSDLPLYTTYRMPPVDTEETIEMLQFLIRHFQIKLIVIDPLYASVSGVSLQEGHFARRAMQNLKDLAQSQNCTIIVLHQVSPTRAERIADSVQLQATASINMTFRRLPRRVGPGRGEGAVSQGDSRITLRCRGRGDFANRTWNIRSEGSLHFEVEQESDGQINLAPKEPELTENERQVQKACLELPLTVEDIHHKTGINVHTLRNLVPKMVRDEKLRKAGKRGNANRYLAPVDMVRAHHGLPPLENLPLPTVGEGQG